MNLNDKFLFHAGYGGEIRGLSVVNKFGQNPSIGTATVPEEIWGVGGVWVPLTTGRIHDVVSSDSADTSAGTGGRTIRIEGIDENWDAASETVIMNGTSTVATVNSYLRIFRMKLLTAGSGRVNAGIITATARTEGTVTAEIFTGNGQSEMAIYSVAANRKAFIKSMFGAIGGGAGSGADADVQLFVRENAGSSEPVELLKHSVGFETDGGSPFYISFDVWIEVPEKSDIFIRVDEVSNNGTIVDGGFNLIEIDA